jgi:hypothetical protein
MLAQSVQFGHWPDKSSVNGTLVRALSGDIGRRNRISNTTLARTTACLPLLTLGPVIENQLETRRLHLH